MINVDKGSRRVSYRYIPIPGYRDILDERKQETEK